LAISFRLVAELHEGSRAGIRVADLSREEFDIAAASSRAGVAIDRIERLRNLPYIRATLWEC